MFLNRSLIPTAILPRKWGSGGGGGGANAWIDDGLFGWWDLNDPDPVTTGAIPAAGAGAGDGAPTLIQYDNGGTPVTYDATHDAFYFPEGAASHVAHELDAAEEAVFEATNLATLNIWIKLDTWLTNTVPFGTRDYSHMPYPGGRWYVDILRGNRLDNITVPVKSGTGWRMWTFVCGGGENYKIYEDAVLKYDANPTAAARVYRLILGRSGRGPVTDTGGDNLQGHLKRCGLWYRHLGIEELTALYAEGTAPTYAQLTG